MTTTPTTTTNDNNDVFVKITAYNGIIVIDGPEKGFKHENWVPPGDGDAGCVVRDSSKHVGISSEALALLRTLKKAPDSIGDVMWWQSGKVHCFGWMGGSKSILDQDALGDRDYAVHENAYVVIPNDVPEEAKDAIDYNL